jgi:hypothetical protein
MSPNQITDIIKRHEEKDDAIANKKKHLSLSSKAYKMFSEGRTNVYVAIKLCICSNKAGYTADSGKSVPLGILEINRARQTCNIVYNDRG